MLFLIPKIPNANHLHNFRPIGLCNTIYKIITKTIANCIKPFLETIIGPYQSSFFKGRRPSDNAIIFQEVIHYLRNSKKRGGSFVLKIDLEKAFNKLEWSFIHETLKFFRFPLILGLSL